MGFDCLSACPECNRHVRCGERSCPFCGAKVASFMRVLEYRIVNRLDRARAFSLGAALTAAGFVTSCESEGGAVYGAPCNPPECGPIGGTSGQAGEPSTGGSGAASDGVRSMGGAGAGGEPALGGAGGEDSGGAGGEGGTD